MREQGESYFPTKSCKFFLGWLKTASDTEVVEKQESYKKSLESLHKSLYKLTWYMRGGVSISELHDMPINHITYLNDIVSENFEMSKKAGVPIL